MQDPRISVFVPNYNHARFLPRALDAILGQSVPPLEIIVIDDCSTDNSMEILTTYARKHPLIRVYANEKNRGVNYGQNRVLELARGDYIMLPAADDEVLPGAFEQATRMFRQHPTAGLFSSMCEWHCTTTGLTWYTGGRMPQEQRYISGEEMVKLSRAGRLALSMPIYRKAALVEIGGFDPELHWATDAFAVYTLGFRHGVCHSPDALVRFNQFPTSYYHSIRSKVNRRAVMERFLQTLARDEFADVTPRIRRSGILGRQLGFAMFAAISRHPRDWRYFNPAYLRAITRRGLEIIGRRLLPVGLARRCLNVFYRGRSRRRAIPAAGGERNPIQSA